LTFEVITHVGDAGHLSLSVYTKFEVRSDDMAVSALSSLVTLTF